MLLSPLAILKVGFPYEIIFTNYFDAILIVVFTGTPLIIITYIFKVFPKLQLDVLKLKFIELNENSIKISDILLSLSKVHKLDSEFIKKQKKDKEEAKKAIAKISTSLLKTEKEKDFILNDYPYAIAGFFVYGILLLILNYWLKLSSFDFLITLFVIFICVNLIAYRAANKHIRKIKHEIYKNSKRIKKNLSELEILKFVKK
jgi:cbb3-type cytochrome oxidase subunit 3